MSDAVARLKELGFFVEQEVHISLGSSGKSVEADLVAWAPDESGELVRDVVVEVKAGIFRQNSLAQLSRIASIAGVRRAFIFTGEWLAVDPSFSSTTPSSPPRPLHRPAQVRVPETMLHATLLRLMWESATASRAKGESLDQVSLASSVVELLCGAPAPNDKAEVLRIPGTELSIARMLAEAPAEVAVPPSLAACLARLIQPTNGMAVLDPSCRSGGCLWAIAEEARLRRVTVTLSGWERNKRLRTLTAQLAAFAKLKVTLEAIDDGPPFLQPLLPLEGVTDGGQKHSVFDAVVSVLPFNAKSSHPYILSTGDQTYSMDLAMLDAVGALLEPGGRAVLVVVPRLLFAEGDAAGVRENLASTMRVVAIIELPAGVFSTTQIPCGILVLEKSTPTETLVARLSNDWQEQLSATGEFLRAYKEHLLRRPVP